MADTKITALTSISTSTDPANDVLPIVDTSDTIMAGTGTTKKVTLNQLLGAGGTASLGTLTVTGASTLTGAATVQGVKLGKGNGSFSSNTVCGVGNLASVTADSGLLALGWGCMPSVTSGSQNAGGGNRCLEALTTGSSNTAFGTLALATISTQDENTAIGRSSLLSSVGGQNTAIGFAAGINHLVGSNNAFFGANAQPSATTISDEYTYGNASVLNHRFSGGNIVVASAKGIDFSATANSSGTMTSELLNDYEEGTWVPTDASGAGLVFTSVASCRYTKIGRAVTIQGKIIYPATASIATAAFTGLPFAASDIIPLNLIYTGAANLAYVFGAGVSQIDFYNAGGTSATNVSLSGVSIWFSGTYMT